MVKSKTRPYFLMGADKEDILQEGMIGLYKAVRDYQPEKNISFQMCIRDRVSSGAYYAGNNEHRTAEAIKNAGGRDCFDPGKRGNERCH